MVLLAFIILVVIFGLIIGSFLNVCIYRLPQNQSIISPGSHCMTCNTRLKMWNLIPVVSYILSRGRCSHCGTVFSLRYAIVELLTAGLFIWCLQVFGLSVELIPAFIFTAFLIIITFIDYDHQLILDNVLLWLSGAGVAIHVWIGNVEIWDMLTASLLGGGILLSIAVASRGGMGGGDIKFAAALGLWLGWKYVVLTLLLAFIFGSIGAIFLLFFKMKGRKDKIPFGPFIAFGAFISMLYGTEIITWYVEYFFYMR